MKRLLTTAALFLCSLLTFAQFSGSGSGTENDPYLILNPIHLNQMRNFLNKEGVYFKLMANIDLTEFIEDEYPSQGWQPIGNSSSSAFMGILDGNGKTISGLWINRSNNDNIGLFGYITSDPIIKNLTVVANTIAGKNNVGGIAGYSKGATISNVSFSGKIKGNAVIGGFVGKSDFGRNYGIILSDCSAFVEIIASENNIGGLVGSGVAQATNCHIYNSKISGANNVGGAFGYIDGNMSSCYIQAEVKGAKTVGGVIGYAAYFNIANSGFIGNVYGSEEVGGLKGYNYKSGETKNCYAIGSVYASGDYSGGLIGYDYGGWGYPDVQGSSITNCYFSGSVFGKNYTAGLVGRKNYGNISHSYTIASVVGAKNVGGLVGGCYVWSLTNSVAINTRVSAYEGEVGRIVGINDEDLPDIHGVGFGQDL